ncbi:hypothetical protein [Methylobacterium sp. 391_Methyba4]|uniref:hypothetical protein n=1 Tax=Methylobacterium sp. 391_Methyba4 TaxID=3038924 RepID=UPI00241FB471|nr:hypothetical protein [Methylobacterium sp. 391_Methyba4]WFS07667.1 hypothetical protein P9K36_30700 [Methylobacterium sp. 391_Methyba4]
MRFEIVSVRNGVNAGDLEIEYNCTDLDAAYANGSTEIQIYRILELRDHWSATFSLGAVGPGFQPSTLSISDMEPGLYKIVRAGTRMMQDPTRLVEHELSGQLHFDYPITKSDELASREIDRIQAARAAIVTQEIAVGTPPQRSPIFTTVIYFSGIRLDHPFVLPGVNIYPIQEPLGPEGIEQPLSSDLRSTLGVDVAFADAIRDEYKSDNRVFGVKFFSLKAASMDLAKKYAEDRAEQIAMLISLERGEKAKHCGTFISDGRSYAFYPLFDGYRGNMAAPMFSDEHAARVLQYQPIIERSEYAKLLLTLLNEAVGERVPSFQYWRCWLIIEQISKKHVTSDALVLTHPDGSQILNNAGKPAKTAGARGKVYKYLIDTAWPEMSLLKPDASGMPPLVEGAQPVTPGAGQTKILLWDALGAVYSIRNKVAHTGHATRSAQPSPEEILAIALSEDGPFLMSFLYRLTANAVWREVNAE